MKQKLLTALSFFVVLPLFILALVVYSLYLLHASVGSHNNLYGFESPVHYQAVPEQIETASISLDPQDARVQVLNDFFTEYNSPLLPFSQNIVDAADKYGLDYRLLPSIAMQESNLCKKIPKDSFNCWGFGIYTGHVTRFTNFSEAIEDVSKTLSQDYKDKGFLQPSEIMAKYTPSSNGSWANGVNFYMGQINDSL